MIDRIVRAIRLDWTVFREIAGDPAAMGQAAIIVVIAGFLSAIGSGAASDSFLSGFIGGWLAEILVGWILWAVVTYLVAKFVFKAKTDIPEMMRVLGYATAPKLLGVLGIIPCVGWMAPIIGWVLALVAGIIAIREAMESETSNAIVTALLSWVIVGGIRIAFGILF